MAPVGLGANDIHLPTSGRRGRGSRAGRGRKPPVGSDGGGGSPWMRGPHSCCSEAHWACHTNHPSSGPQTTLTSRPQDKPTKPSVTASLGRQHALGHERAELCRHLLPHRSAHPLNAGRPRFCSRPTPQEAETPVNSGFATPPGGPPGLGWERRLAASPRPSSPKVLAAVRGGRSACWAASEPLGPRALRRPLPLVPRSRGSSAGERFSGVSFPPAMLPSWERPSPPPRACALERF